MTSPRSSSCRFENLSSGIYRYTTWSGEIVEIQNCVDCHIWECIYVRGKNAVIRSSSKKGCSHQRMRCNLKKGRRGVLLPVAGDLPQHQLRSQRHEAGSARSSREVTSTDTSFADRQSRDEYSPPNPTRVWIGAASTVRQGDYTANTSSSRIRARIRATSTATPVPAPSKSEYNTSTSSSSVRGASTLSPTSNPDSAVRGRATSSKIPTPNPTGKRVYTPSGFFG